MPIYDLSCADGHTFPGEFRHRYPDGGDFGPCPTCATPMRQDWRLAAGDPARKFDAFIPVEIEGQRFTDRSTFEGYLGELRRSHPGREVVVEGASRARNRADAEEHRHALYRRNSLSNEREFHQRLADTRSHPPRR